MLSALLTLSLALTNPVSNGARTDLEKLLKETNLSYKDATTSNWIGYRVFATDDLNRLSSKAESNLIRDEAELHYAISDCLLITETAYSPVIDPDVRHSLAKATTAKLIAWTKAYALTQAFSRISYNRREFQDFAAGFDIINASCSLRIELPDGLSLVADAHSVD
jgi:hypothetical protein